MCQWLSSGRLFWTSNIILNLRSNLKLFLRSITISLSMHSHWVQRLTNVLNDAAFNRARVSLFQFSRTWSKTRWHMFSFDISSNKKISEFFLFLLNRFRFKFQWYSRFHYFLCTAGLALRTTSLNILVCGPYSFVPILLKQKTPTTLFFVWQ